MKIIEGIKMAGRNLKKRKGRTFLTALGVIIGIGAVFTIISLSTGLQEMNQQTLSNAEGMRSIDVAPGNNEKSDDKSMGLTVADISNLSKIEGVLSILPEIALQKPVMLGFTYYEAENTTVLGFIENKKEQYEFKLLRGRLPISNNEALIGEKSYQYFKLVKEGSSESVEIPQSFDFMNRNISITQMETSKNKEGKFLPRVNVEEFNVVGILAENNKGLDFGLNSGPEIYLTADKIEGLNNWYSTDEGRNSQGEKIYSSATVTVENQEKIGAVSAHIIEKGFKVFSLNSLIEQLNVMLSAVKVILGGIAGIALIVATINIMNTMYMSILERNKEIGVMKVLGAPISAIRQMFLYEAGFIGFIGGLLGVLLGIGVTAILGNALASYVGGSEGGQFPFKVDFVLVFALMAIATFVGMFAGFLPANKGAKISPLDAIRNE